MSTGSLATAHRLLTQAVDEVNAVAGSGGDDELIALLRLCEGAARQLDRAVVEAVAGLERRGVFAERGYKSPVNALSDLLGWERFEARRQVIAAEQVGRCPGRIGRDCASGAAAGHCHGVRRWAGPAAARRGDCSRAG